MDFDLLFDAADDMTLDELLPWLDIAEASAGGPISPEALDLLIVTAGLYCRDIEEAFNGFGPTWGVEPYTGGDLKEWAIRAAVQLTTRSARPAE